MFTILSEYKSDIYAEFIDRVVWFHVCRMLSKDAIFIETDKTGHKECE